MVFKCNERSSIEESIYLSQKRSEQMDFGDQPLSFVDVSQLSSIHEKPCASDEGEETVDQPQGEEKPMVSAIEFLVAAESNCGNGIDSAANDNQSASADATISGVSGAKIGFGADIVRSEVSKRTHSGDDSCQLASKRPRPLNSCSSFLSDEALHHGNGPEASLASDAEDEENAGQFNGGEACSTFAKSVSKDLNFKVFACIQKLNGEATSVSSSSRDKQTYHKAAAWEFPFYMPYSPRLIEKDEPSNESAVSDDTPLAFYDRFPRKHVALGPDHQVNVPVWGSEMSKDSNEEDSELLMGKPVLPMPDADEASLEDLRGGYRVNDCYCSNLGSIRCVRKHVAEARERAKRTLGLEKFSELGLCDMGEDAALRWSEDEEQVFHEVVFANPVSHGKNFWKVLPQVFPSRSTKDFVSYYFNVFMLRKRAAQNRADPWNVDSDNDEWQESDDSEFTMEDGEGDFAVESPMDHEVAYANDHEEEREEEDEEDYHGEPNEEGTCDEVEHDIQDNSCTSYEGQHNGADSCGGPYIVPAAAETSIADAVHKDLHEDCRVDSSSGSVNPYMPGSCDPKAWDVSYFSRSEKVDFLPTCYVIDEVFGKGTWDADARDGHGIM